MLEHKQQIKLSNFSLRVAFSTERNFSGMQGKYVFFSDIPKCANRMNTVH